MRSGQHSLTAASTELKNSLPWAGKLYTIIPYFIPTCNIIYLYRATLQERMKESDGHSAPMTLRHFQLITIKANTPVSCAKKLTRR